MIVSPVSRDLAVANVERSTAFYRDVLALDATVQIHFVTAPDPARSILFFETDDVDALHAAMASHGGSPSAIERVNWIKMRMFEVRDPDGHVLWFGQSWEQPPIESHTPPGRGQLRKALPSMPLTDIAAGIAHYRDVLGFTVNYAQDDLGVMDRDSITILLVPRKDGPASCYIYIRDADALHAELVGRGANVQGEPQSHPWGLRDFRVLDPEGNELIFGQTFE